MKRKRSHWLGTAFIGAGLVAGMVALQGCDGKTAAVLPDQLEWPLYGQGQMGQRAVENSRITSSNVKQLGFAFEFTDFVVRGRTHRAMETTPLMLDGVLYFSGPWGVAYAVDARTGQHLWTYDPDADGEAARNACCDAVSRGVAVAGKRLFTAGTDGQLAAVDIATGKELWKVDTIDNRQFNYSSTGAPFVAGDLVVIGNSGADMGARGYASAYDQATGKLRWRFWVVPGDPAAGPDENEDVTFARKTWPKDTRWELGLGGNPWDGFAYDPETDTVFIGTGNGGPHPSWRRSASGDTGDELYLSSIVAVDAKTGRRKWHYQTTPGDNWDYAATSPLVMADIEIDGAPRKVIMQAPKNGFFYVLDRETGELLRANAYTSVNWAKGVDPKTGRPILNPDGNYKDEAKIVWPSMAGGHAWTPMAYSEATGFVYLPVYDTAASYQLKDTAPFTPGSANHGTHNAFPPFTDPALEKRFENGPSQAFEGRLKAWNPKTGDAAWVSEPLPLLNGGTLVLGDMVVQGLSDGTLRFYDAKTGAVLHTIQIGTSIMAAPMSYVIDGEQYVAVTAGYGGPQGGFFAPGSAPAKYENYERLVVLKLEGAKVPLPPAHEPAAVNPLPAAIPATPAQMATGQTIFEKQCARCHLLGGADGIYPNLWNMDQTTADNFEAIVGQGAFAYAGMGNFSNVLSDSEIEALKAFILTDMRVKRTEGQQAGAQFREASH